MMEHKMTEKKNRLPRDRAMKVMLQASFGLAVIMLLGRFAGIIPTAAEMSPAGAIFTCAVLSIFLIGLFGWYLARTDEHDLHANLWSMAWAWIGGALLAVNWTILHIAGVAPRADAGAIFLASAVLAMVVWLWLRFR